MNDRICVMSKSEVYGLGITGFLVKRNSIDKAVIIEYKLNIAERPFWPNSCYDGCENVSCF